MENKMIHNIGIGIDTVRACFCVGKIIGCTCGGRCRCECSCTELKHNEDNAPFKAWGKVLDNYFNKPS